MRSTSKTRSTASYSRKSSTPAEVSRLALGLLSTAIWMLCSSLLIVMNKNLYKKGFTFPFFVTGMGQVFSAVGGLALVRLGYLPMRPAPSTKFWVTKLLPITVSTAATMFFGNNAYLYLSVAFIQILKAFTPALTLLLCVIVGVEKAQWPLVMSVLLIAVGTGSAVWIESGAPSFSLLGFLSFMMSSMTEAFRVVGAQVLLGAEKFNTAEALVYIGVPTTVMLLFGAFVWESPHLYPALQTAVVDDPLALFGAFFMSFLVNLSCFFAIQNTSSLSFKVAGCLKNLAVVWYGVAAHGEHVTFLQVCGYFVSVIGFALYSKLRINDSNKKAKLA